MTMKADLEKQAGPCPHVIFCCSRTLSSPCQWISFAELIRYRFGGLDYAKGK